MALPAAAYLSNSSRTVAEMKTAMEDHRDTTAQLPGATARIELTISGGAIVPPDGSGGGFFRVDTEGDAATDDLTSITTTNCWDGMLVWLGAENTGRVVTIKHGTGNIQTIDSQDFVFASLNEWICFQLRSSTWVEVNRRIDDCLVQVTLGTLQNLTANTPTKVAFDTEVIDANGCFTSSAGNHYFTAPVKGWYSISGSIGVATQSVADGGYMYAAAYKDTGSGFSLVRIQGAMRTGAAGMAPRSVLADEFPLNAGDKLAIYAYVSQWVTGTGQISTDSVLTVRRTR